MNSFEKLFVNSTNRFSAVKNIILTQGNSNFTPLQPNEYQNISVRNKNAFLLSSCSQSEPTQTFQELQQKYQQLSKIVKQANHEKQMMTMLLDKIFKIQQGQEEKLRKRFRRKKNEIQSKFECKVSNCNKIYSSSASLVRHTKLKHAYSMCQPPEHNYSIPPSPNLKQSQDTENKALAQLKAIRKDGNEDDEEGDAKQFQSEDDFYEADCENSVNLSQELEES